MKRKPVHLFLILILLACVLNLESKPEPQNLNEFIAQIQNSIMNKDLAAYLENFIFEIRETEESNFKNMFDLFEMESVALFKTSELSQTGDTAEIYLQAFFQNSFSVIIETWHLNLVKVGDLWKVKEKEIMGNISSLYRIRIPSDRVEKVKSFEVEHKDIKISFRDALLFYDNIPEMETALIAVGRGHLHFSPSSPVERHQLKLSYKKEYLEDELTYVYLRFSNRFFRENIKVVKDADEKNVLQPQERNEAQSIFERHYSRSFTVENSLNKELLSTLPQGDEAVFGFKGKNLGTFTYIYSPFSDEEINFFRWRDDKIINLYSPDSGEKERRMFLSFVQMFEVKDYEIDLDFKPEQYYLSGKARITVESKVESLDRLKFKLNPRLSILRITDNEGRALFYSQDKLRETLYVYFVQPPPQKEPYAIEVYYRGKLEPPEQIADVVAAAQIYKWGGRFGQNINFLSPEYETYLFSRSASWYPAPSENDYFQARLKISVPPQFQCISNGKLMEETLWNGQEKVKKLENAKSAVFVYQTTQPVKYLSFIVGIFTTAGEDAQSIPVQHLYSSGINFSRKETLQEAKNILRFFEERFGPYPYGKLSVVRRLWITAGGHSPASFIILNELFQAQDGSVLVPMRTPVDLSRWREYFIAHEIAHQWWGQAVTWKSYHDHWLSEGLAQFAAVQYLAEKHGKEVYSPIFQKFSYWTEKKSEWGPISLGARLSLHDPFAYHALIYNKTALVLNMLKDMLGENAFYEGLKGFYLRHRYGAASTRDFIDAMEEVTGKELDAFFKMWFGSYLLPEVRISHSVHKTEEGYVLKLKVNQRKETFVFPLWIEWTEEGTKAEKMVVVEKPNEEFEIKIQERPRRIKVNPDRAVPGKFR